MSETSPVGRPFLRHLLAAALCCSSVAVGHALLSAQGQTVRDGVYTTEQATRGQSTYLDECGRCHAETLAGGDFGPSLTGDEFWGQWKDRPLAEVFDRIKDTMPQDNPGRLNAAQTADVLAFMMKTNGFPSGDIALGTTRDALATITVSSR